MIYKEYQNLKLSMLGFGTMRLPLKGEDLDSIDEEEVAKMFEYAIKKGINYFDTAWGYHNGKSEIVTGKTLKNYPRESFYLASKFPGYDLSNMSKVEEIFEKQLEKCQVEYFDFYLFHNVNEKNIDEYLDEKYGIAEYLLKQKENGRIKHLGFSCHGSVDVTKRFLEKYGQYMEFGQIQLNYLDYKFQNAKEQVKLLTEYNIPIWVMEPLRGGKLAKLLPQHEEKLKELRADETVPGWAFRFLQSIDNVAVVLSGMSTMEQLEQNIKTFEENKSLNSEEMEVILGIANDMLKVDTLPCTGCSYCTEYCPKGLNIPELISLYNEYTFTGGGFLAPMKISALPEEKRPTSCIGCQSCEAVCPQKIKIAEAMEKLQSIHIK